METALTFAQPGLLTQLRRSLAADVLKLKHTPALWLTLGSGALPVLLFALIFFFKGQFILKPGENPWPAYILQSWQTATGLLLPLFVVLLSSLVLHTENKALAWKHLYAQPLSRAAVFGSKLLVLLGLNLLAQVVYAVLLVASGWLLGVLRPGLHFADFAAPLGAIVPLLWHTFVATLGILALQYVAALWWRSFAAPVAVGMACTIVALTLMRWEYINWVPYAAPLLSLKAVGKGLAVGWALSTSGLLALGWAAAALLLGYVLLGFRHEGAAR
ncbi:ABC transporter permease [Hymenobacter sp. 15J16-1T3B]|uniref:ABC transporter permease n=1 Tax=Hymenobacter sp. 15J16-1T3B TaxID=2886941 RepID=UPI001D0FD393|nr:ABC transporter permease [Hymenobacter sp. 15J16-1T3B]MCC3157808.1 ABC transporter permease [Hymenobacter sp. 15J16-1T3B]